LFEPRGKLIYFFCSVNSSPFFFGPRNIFGEFLIFCFQEIQDRLAVLSEDASINRRIEKVSTGLPFPFPSSPSVPPPSFVHPLFPLPRSPFPVPRSPFPVPRSPFLVPPFPVPRFPLPFLFLLSSPPLPSPSPFNFQELAEYRSDMLRDYTYHLDRVDAILLKLEERGNSFFKENITISNILALTNSENVKRDFEAKVIGKTMYVGEGGRRGREVGEEK
jgi:hypothetical protein